MKLITIILILVLTSFTGLWAQPNPPGQGGGFVTNDTVGCAPYVVSLASFTPGAVSHNWDFGNGTTSIQANPTAIYMNSGIYTITLDVVYVDGTTDHFVRTNYIEVSEKPTIDFTLNSFSPCVNNNEITLQNNTTGASQFLWDFGDGVLTTDVSPIHQYSSTGSFNVTMFATNQTGCTSDTSFSVNILPVSQTNVQTNGVSVSCDSTHLFSFDATSQSIQSYLWQFSDGSQYNGPSVQHAFNTSGTFDLQLITTDQNGCMDTTITNDIAEVIGNHDSFTANTINTCIASNITFTSNTSGATNVSWDFGDGQQANGLSVSHAYQQSGSYDVTMTSSYPGGCVKTITQTNYIVIGGAVNVSLSISDTIVCVGEEIQLEAVSSNLPAVKWFFGDGISTPSLAPITTQEYTIPGNFTIRLVHGSTGCADTIFQEVTVSQPTSAFQNITSSNCAPTSIQFNNLSTSAVGWQWTFSDGQTSQLENPQITFSQSGGYDVELIAIDQNGCTDTSWVEDAVTISNNVPPGFQYGTFTGCSPFSVSLFDYSIGSGNWSWDFGDGTTSTLPNPEHIYSLPGDYVVSLNTIDSLGCGVNIDSFAIISVNMLPIDSIDIDLDCDSALLEYSVHCPDCSSGIWDFGDGFTSSIFSSVKQYSNPGPFNISFTGVSDLGCVGSRFFVVDLDSCVVYSPVGGTPPDPSTPLPVGPPGWVSNPIPDSIPSEPVYEYCGPITISITNPVPQAQNWVWNFGDGSTGYGIQPQHTYTSSGIYSIMLEFDEAGIHDTLYYHYFIKVNGHSNQILTNTSSNCNNLEVDILSQDTSLLFYNWSLNNQHLPYSSFNFDTVFVNSNQLHSLVLTTVDTNYCTYSTSAGILSQGIDPEFILDTAICIGDTLTISHTLPNYMQVVWDFGDGVIGTDPLHVYSDEGVYQINVTAMDSSGCVLAFYVEEVEVNDVNGVFVYSSPGSLCVGDTIFFNAQDLMNDSYSWSLSHVTMISGGPNGIGIVEAPGVFDISLETSNNGCVAATDQLNVYTVNQAQVDFSYTQDNLCLPISCQFTDLSTAAVSWDWNFGDGSFSQVQNPSHIYGTVPNNLVTLSIVDSNGCAASISKNSIDIYNAQLNVSAMSGCAPVSIAFTENSQNTIQWKWSFGDGSMDTVATPNHVYNNPGTYDISLIATSADGCVDTAYIPALIDVDIVTADFSSSVNTGCAPQPAFFTNNSYNAVSWHWTFGNGANSSLENPVQVYYVGGNYNVQLIAESASGCLDTISSSIDVLGPLAEFSLTDTIFCEGESTSFINNSIGATSYSWLFGDGSSSGSLQPDHQYANSGIYNVTLIASDNNGCQDVKTQPFPITIHDLPDPSFLISDTSGCDPLPVSLSAIAPTATYQWQINGSNVSTNMNYNTNLTTGTYQVGLIVTSSEGCVDSSLLDTIEVLPVYSIQIDPIAPVCETTPSITVNSSVSIGNWSINGVPNTSNQFDLTGLQPGEYTLVQEISTLCGDVDSVVLHIDSMITVDIQPFQVTCENDAPFNLLASSGSGYWSGPGVVDPFNGVFDPGNANHGVNQLAYTLTNGSCLFIDSTEVVVNRTPDVSFSIPSTKVCEGNLLSIIPPVNASNAIYHWTIWSSTDSVTSNMVSPEITLAPDNWNVALEVSQNGCVNTSSLTGVVVLDTIAPNSPDIIRSTVFENEAVLTEWEDPKYGEEKITGYQIWRSIDSLSFSLIETVENTERSYIDYSTDVHHDNYYYLIVPNNVCNVAPEPNLMSSNILLKKEETTGGEVMFIWNEYYKWEQGVDHYELQRQNEDGEWETIETIDETKHAVVIQHP